MIHLYISSFIIFIATVFGAPIQSNKGLSHAYTQLTIRDIGNINQAVKALTTHIDAYQGGVLQASPLFTGLLDIHLVNRKAFADAAVPTPKGNDKESKRIVTFTEKSVGQSIPTSVQALEEKKQLLEEADISGFVVPGLKLLLHDHDSYSAELLKKVAPAFLAQADAVVKKIHDAIQGGIDFFQQ